MSLNVSFLPLAVKDLPSCARSRKDEGWRLVQMLCVRTEKGTDLIYSFMKDDALENYTIKDVKGGMEIPSISESFLNAFVFENEAHDLFGVQVTDIAIDFAGKFYAVSQSEPMTVISPAQKEAREKAAKIAAAKAAKEAKGATGGSTPEAAKSARPARAKNAAPAANVPRPAKGGASAGKTQKEGE